jgi:hypothetical protein
VDAELDGVAELGDHRRGRVGHRGRQRRAVGVAERQVLRAGLGRRPQAAQRVARVVGVGVEEVLGVVDHPLALAAQERDRVGDHPQVLLRVDARHLLEMQRPRLADERADRREALGEHAQPGVLGGGAVLASRHPERRDLGVLERLAGQRLEQRLLLRVRAGEARLDQVDAKIVERMRDTDLLVRRQRHPLPLHTVAEGGVVEEYLLCHGRERLSDVNFERTGRAPARSRRASGRRSALRRVRNSLETGVHAFDGTGTTSSHFE